MYLFDTDHVVIIQRQAQPEYSRLLQRMRAYPPSEFSLSLVSFQEQVMGANGLINRARSTAQRIRGYELLELVLATYSEPNVLPYDNAAETIFVSLRSQKVRIGTMDLRIASTALSRNLTVLTRNLGDFQQVPGLMAEDWTT